MIKQMTKAAEQVMQVYGIRIVDEPVESIIIGGELAPSRVWIDNDATTDLLDGACAVCVAIDRDATESDFARALEACATYSGQTIVLIGGRNGYTYGEDKGEVVIKRATVLGAWSR